MSAASLTVKQVSWAPSKRAPLLLHPLSLTLDAGKTLGIVGANGAGKSTLLRLLYRYNRPLSGQICVDGDDIWHLSPKQAACKIAAVLQEQPTDFALSVRDIVALGRTPHQTGLANNGTKDNQIIEASLAQMDLSVFSDRMFGSLSGGERQRVMVARALAQQPQILILDEPTNHLDIRHQLEIVSLIRTLDLTIITSLHDLNMAADVCDEILMLKQGHLVGHGKPDDLLSEQLVSTSFSVTARRDHLSLSDQSHFTFHLSA